MYGFLIECFFFGCDLGRVLFLAYDHFCIEFSTQELAVMVTLF